VASAPRLQLRVEHTAPVPMGARSTISLPEEYATALLALCARTHRPDYHTNPLSEIAQAFPMDPFGEHATTLSNSLTVKRTAAEEALEEAEALQVRRR
jgi:hypothetical protein